MSFLSALFKNPLERAFERQSLSIDLQRPEQCGYTSYSATYNGNPAQVLLYPKETPESSFLLKHPSLLRIYAYTKYEEGGLLRWAVLTDPLEPVQQAATLLIALKAALEGLEFLYANGKALARFSRSAMALEEGNAVFIQLDAIGVGSGSYSDISSQVEDCFREVSMFGVKFSQRLDEMLSEPALSGEVFELLEGFSSGYKDTEFLQRLVNFARNAEAQLIALVLLPLILRQFKLEPEANLHKAACIMAHTSSKHLPPEAFESLVRTAISQPELAPNLLYFKEFSYLNERSSETQLDLVVFLLEKQPQNSTICKLAELAALLFKENSRLIAGSHVLSESFFEMLGRAVRNFETKSEYLTSWNIFSGCSALLAEESAPMKQSSEVLRELFAKNMFEAAITSISNCYDCIQALLCCSRILPVISDMQLLELYTAMSTAHALRYGLYSGRKQQRELAMLVRNYIDQKMTSEADSECAEPNFVETSKPEAAQSKWASSSVSSDSESYAPPSATPKPLLSDKLLQEPIAAQPKSVVREKPTTQRAINNVTGWDSSFSDDSEDPHPTTAVSKPLAEREQPVRPNITATNGNTKAKKSAWDDSDDPEG